MHPQHPMNTGKPWPREIIDPSMIPTGPSWPPTLPRGPIGRVNQAPRPEGFQRAVTGLADYITGNKWDFDQRGRGGPNHWSEQQRRPEHYYHNDTWDARNDINFVQNQIPGPPVPTQNPQQQESRNFLGRFLGKLGEIWNKPIMAPTITKQEHDRMIRGENTGPNNWDSRY